MSSLTNQSNRDWLVEIQGSVDARKIINAPETGMSLGWCGYEDERVSAYIRATRPPSEPVLHRPTKRPYRPGSMGV